DRRHERAVARIPDRHQHVAHEPVAADALDRRAREPAAEAGIVEPGKLDQRRCDEFLARPQLGLAPGGRELVPGADGKAVITAIDPVAHGPAQLARDLAPMLDGKIAEGAPGIEL